MAKVFKIGSPRFLTGPAGRQPGAVPRSWLVVSGEQPTPCAEAECIVFDLANVAPTSIDIGELRRLTEAGSAGAMAALLPAVSSPALEATAAMAVDLGLATVILSRAASGAEVQRLDALLRVLEAGSGKAPLAIVALLDESGLLAAQTFQHCSSRLRALGLQLSSAADPESAIARLARAQLLLAARAADLAAIGSACAQSDMERFRNQCLEARRDGFHGQFTVLPQQVPIINAVFGADNQLADGLVSSKTSEPPSA